MKIFKVIPRLYISYLKGKHFNFSSLVFIANYISGEQKLRVPPGIISYSSSGSLLNNFVARP